MNSNDENHNTFTPNPTITAHNQNIHPGPMRDFSSHQQGQPHITPSQEAPFQQGAPTNEPPYSQTAQQAGPTYPPQNQQNMGHGGPTYQPHNQQNMGHGSPTYQPHTQQNMGNGSEILDPHYRTQYPDNLSPDKGDWKDMPQANSHAIRPSVTPPMENSGKGPLILVIVAIILSLALAAGAIYLLLTYLPLLFK